MNRRSQPDGEMLKGTLDMMILRTLITGTRMGTPSPKSSSELQRMFWKSSKDRFTRVCIDWRIVDGIFVLGREREQSQGEVLSAYCRRKKTTGT